MMKLKLICSSIIKTTWNNLNIWNKFVWQLILLVSFTNIMNKIRKNITAIEQKFTSLKAAHQLHN